MSNPPRTEPSATASDAVVERLRQAGVDTVFGLPGFQSYHLFDAFAKAGNGLRVIHPRHEQGAGYMAFGYAKSTGKLGVASVVPGPGVLNASAALLTAQSASAPLLCLAGEIPATWLGKGHHFLHEMRDQRATLATIAKWAGRVESAADAEALADEAILQATSGRPGVACLDMPMDIQAEPLTASGKARPQPAIAEPNADAIAAAVKAMAKGQKPMILVGSGAIDAQAEVVELSRRLQAPVVSFRSGKGIVSDRDPLGFNVVAAARLWPEVDTLIAIGSQMEEPYQNWGGLGGRTLIRFDIDPVEMVCFGTPDVSVLGDAKVALQAVLAALTAKKAFHPDHLMDIKKGVEAAAAQVEPQASYLKAIRDVLPDDGIFVDEVTQVGYASWYAFPCYQPRRFISSGYQGNLGYGYATAIGAKAANPNSPVVAIAGDGGFMFNVQELATAVRERLNVVSVVFNNQLFGNVARDQSNLFSGRVIGATLKNPNFPAMAEAFGARGMRAENPDALRKCLEKAFADDGPTVIEVPMPEYANPWPLLFPNGYGKVSAKT